MRYLSDDWFRGFAASLAAARTPGNGRPTDDGPGVTLGYVIDDVPDDAGVDADAQGSVRYSLRVVDGEIALHRPPRGAADVEFRQGFATALSVATGQRGSADAVAAGDIVVTGDPRVLTPVVPLLRSVDTPRPS